MGKIEKIEEEVDRVSKNLAGFSEAITKFAKERELVVELALAEIRNLLKEIKNEQ